MDRDLAARLAGQRDILQAALARMRSEAAQWGIALDGVDEASARFAFQQDPFSGDAALLARWVHEHRRTSLSIREDGYVYGETDVLAPHPSQPAQWIEAVVLWGRPPHLKSEPRLIEMPA